MIKYFKLGKLLIEEENHIFDFHESIDYRRDLGWAWRKPSEGEMQYIAYLAFRYHILDIPPGDYWLRTEGASKKNQVKTLNINQGSKGFSISWVIPEMKCYLRLVKDADF